MSGVCPECAGEQMPNHPAGVLAIRQTNACQLRAAEDSTAANDAEQGERLRPATTAERTLLDALGYLVPGSPPGTGYRYPGPDHPPLQPITLKGTP